jgi:SAM-dependent methyltransferase
MQEILKKLKPGSRVLDLGSGAGSFDGRPFPAFVVRADLSPPREHDGTAVACTAWALPFAGGAFAGIILNHSLEHFENLPECLSEAGRVLAPNGLLYIAVPDASTLTDRLYRWLARGGGHVNQFRHPEVLAQMITEATGLPYAGSRTLVSSLSFLNRKNISSRPPRKLWLLGYGHEGILRWLTLILRLLDRWFGLRMSVYGWALYFGAVEPIKGTWSNVCIGCGSGHPASLLKQSGAVMERLLRPSVYTCLQCGTNNYFTVDPAV